MNHYRAQNKGLWLALVVKTKQKQNKQNKISSLYKEIPDALLSRN